MDEETIQNFKQPWLPFLYYIDLRSYEWPWLEEQWNNIESYIVKIYAIDYIPRGFCLFKIIPDNIIRVSKLCVNPKWRRQGIGGALHDNLLEFARDHKKNKLTTTIHEQNLTGMDWLKQHGWQAVAIKKEVFPDNTDGFIFERGVVQ